MIGGETVESILKIGADLGFGAVGLALWFKLGAIVANHELRIIDLERAHLGVRRRRRGVLGRSR
jgi:hypothetical protein